MDVNPVAKANAEKAPVKGVAPQLTSNDGQAQMDFYVKAFDAKVLNAMQGENGKYMHINLGINDGNLLMSDAMPEYGYPYVAPAGYTVHLQVAEPQKWFDRAVAAGCTATVPMEVMFWGDRYGQLKDPFDVTWSIGGPA